MTASQCNSILAYLKTGKTITVMEGNQRFGSTCFPRRILDLKQRGHPIDKTMVQTDSGKRIARYYLDRSNG